MPNKSPVPTPQSRALAAAMKARGLKNVDIANAVGLTAGAVSQWVTGGRPIPIEKVPVVAELVGAKPEALSARYEAIYSQAVPAMAPQSGDVMPSELTVNRLENGIDAMRLAMGVMAGVMVLHRPVEARDAAKALRKKLPGKFVNQGFVKELLGVLEAAS